MSAGMNMLLACGLEGLAVVLAFWWATVALTAQETQARALGYCTGLSVGIACAAGGFLQGTIAAMIALAVVWWGLPAAARDARR